MPTPKYDFTASNGQLVATLDNTVPDFSNSEVLEYRAASVNLSNPISPQETKKILLYNYGDFEREFIFENFKTIGGVTPTDISNAHTLLRALIPSSDIGNVVPGVSATSLGKAEDSVSATGDTGVAMLAVRSDSLTSNTSASGDYSFPAVDLYGATIIKDQQRHKRTYSTTFSVVPATAATDIFQLRGSASTTVEITKIVISGTQTTGGMANFIIAKRSTVNSGGTSSASVMVPHISSDAAATAVGAIYTANPTTGTLVGNIEILSIPLSAITGITNNIVERRFGQNSKPIILSGVAQALVLNLNGITLAGGSINIAVEFTEY